MGANDPSILGAAAGEFGDATIRHAGDIYANPLNLYAKTFALTTLALPIVQDIEFETPSVKVDHETFDAVRSAIGRAQINVALMEKDDPDRDIGAAVYLSDENLMKLASVDTSRDRPATSLIHESVHASHDILGLAQLTVWQTEQAAYIAEAVFTRLMPKYADAVRPPPFLQNWESAAYNGLYRPAWNLAIKIVDGGTKKIPPADVDLLNLYAAIQVAPPYKDNWADNIVANGV